MILISETAPYIAGMGTGAGVSLGCQIGGVRGIIIGAGISGIATLAAYKIGTSNSIGDQPNMDTN